MRFEAHDFAMERKASAILCIKRTLTIRYDPDSTQSKVKKLLKALLYNITEAEATGKYSIRYHSTNALRCNDKQWLIHEHVYQRIKMVDELFAAKNEQEIEEILHKAVACVVTDQENIRLAEFHEQYYGWERYILAGIKVIDTITNKELNLKRMSTKKSLSFA
jgi:hypothetical protein